MPSTLALDETAAKTFRGFFPVSKDTLMKTWQGPRGLEMARQLALRDVPWTIYQKMPAIVMGVGILHQGAFAANPTPDQEALSWKIAGDLDQAYFIDDGHWQNPGLWPGHHLDGRHAPSGLEQHGEGLAEPPMRGPLAYVFGARYLHHLKNSDEAAPLLPNRSRRLAAPTRRPRPGTPGPGGTGQAEEVG